MLELPLPPDPPLRAYEARPEYPLIQAANSPAMQFALIFSILIVPLAWIVFATSSHSASEGFLLAALWYFKWSMVPAYVIAFGVYVVIYLDANNKHKEAEAKWKRLYAEWQAEIERIVIAARRRDGAAVLDSLLQEANRRGRALVTRRAELVKKFAALFQDYRLKRDWDGKDEARLARIRQGFAQHIAQNPPFPPEDMALLAAVAPPELRAFLPPQLR